MSIYTKKGDSGTTSLIGGTRISKSDIQVDAYGAIDELNSSISLANKAVQINTNAVLLESIQHQLFYLGAEIATSKENAMKGTPRQIELTDIHAMECAIDRCMSALPPVQSFVLPGSSEAGSRLHCARTVARRSERRLVALSQRLPLRPMVLEYMNRLSDLLYALARSEDNHDVTETIIKTVVENYCEAASHSSEPLPSQDNHHGMKHRHVEKDTNTMASSNNLNFNHVHQIMQQAIKASLALNVPVVISIVDEVGHLIMTYRMPDALLLSTELAPKKAYTSVALKRATHQLSDLIQPGTDLYQLETMCDGKIVTFGGGIPLFRKQKLIGAIGISGGTVKQDVEIALCAIKNVELEEK